MSNSTGKSQPPTVVTFRPDFCTPAFLNSLLRIQNLHWLEIRHGQPGCNGGGGVSAFLFVIPASLPNLVCVIGTEVPFLEAELGCRVRQVPVPDFIAPDGLQAFSVAYATTGCRPGAHARFLSALRAICVRLQLSNICVDPGAYLARGSGGSSGGCAACAKVRTHTKSVRGSSAVRQLRRPALTLDLARPRTRRPASAEAAAAGDARKTAMTLASKAARMTEDVGDLCVDRLIAEATGAAALLATAASEVLRVCSGGECLRRPHQRQYGLDFCVTFVIADAVAARERLYADTVAVFAGWTAELASHLLAGVADLVADGVARADTASGLIADAAADHLGRQLASLMTDEMAEVTHHVQISLPCDWRTRRSLLGLQPMHRRCPSCGAYVTADVAGAKGFRLTIRSLRKCSRHASLLQLADCARSSKDAHLGSLLLQEVAALPILRASCALRHA